jgi:hypothetical protein
MEISYFGKSGIKLKSGSESVGFDLEFLGLSKKPNSMKEMRSVFYTDIHRSKESLTSTEVMTFNRQGEYEVRPFSVRGVSVKAYGDIYGTTKSTVFLADAMDFGSVGIIGYATKNLNEEAMELLANARLLIIPIGGMGMGLEPEEAMEVVKNLNCEYVIPVHYEDGFSKYASPQAELGDFLKLIGEDSTSEVFEGKVSSKEFPAAGESFKVVVVSPKASS